MVKKLYPLCENHLFSKAYRKGKSAANRYVAVYVLKNYGNKKGTPALTKLGITVNKKLGKATKRSRVKRIIRAAYRENMPVIKNGFIIIVAARSACFDKGVKSTAVAKQMKKSFEQLGILVENTGEKR
jgi:ribonuclease P protein component